MLQQLVMKIVLWGTAAISGLYALLWAARALALLVVWAVALALIIVAVIAAITIPTLAACWLWDTLKGTHATETYVNKVVGTTRAVLGRPPLPISPSWTRPHRVVVTPMTRQDDTAPPPPPLMIEQ
jgi:hypothetical protein